VEIILTDAQLAVIAQLDPKRSAAEIVQLHVDTWLYPLVKAAEHQAQVELAQAYLSADADTQAAVRSTLKMADAIAIAGPDGVMIRG